MRLLVAATLVLTAATALPAHAEAPAGNTDTGEDDLGSYPLDSLSRDVSGGKAACPPVEMERYRGSIIRYHKATPVYRPFIERLHGLEEIARDTAVEVYGRAPIRLRHVGTYNCRAVRGIATLLSEHALANAIDVEGFDFGPAPKGAASPPGLRRSFNVRLGRDWLKTTGPGALHAKFLRLLAERVIARPDLFRVVLGPSYPGHKGHFHFDEAPYRVVSVFGT